MSADAPSALIEACKITVWRGETLVLDAVDFHVLPGGVTQLRGANGSGKTTLLRVLTGLVPADEGEVRWRGDPMHRVRDRFHAEALYLGHRVGLSGDLTPRENLTLACRLTGVDPRGIDAALEAVALARRRDLPCRMLSAGQQRRVALARLLLQPAALWILDEPFTALDAAGTDWVESRLGEQIDTGGAVLLTSHQPLRLADIEVRAIDVESC